MRIISGNYIKDYKEVPFKCEVPGSWTELDPKQFSRIIQVLHYSKADEHTISVSLLGLLFGRFNFHILENLPDEDLYNLVPLTNFIRDEKPSVSNPFPNLKIHKRWCAAPADDLSNLSFGEWCFAFQFFTYYKLTNDDSWIVKLLACLYRPADPNQKLDSPEYSGDVREQFNENLIESRAIRIASIPEHMRLGILAWFTLAVQNIMEQRPLVFPVNEIDPEESAADAEEMPEMDSRTWLTVFRELLGPKWGTTNQLKHTNAMFILDALEEQQIAYKEALAAQKS
ncbi:hypothetical protein ACVWYN_002681 [Pedobacter sp. UYP24]